MANDEFIIGKKMKFYKYIHTQTSKPKKDNIYRWDILLERCARDLKNSPPKRETYYFFFK